MIAQRASKTLIPRHHGYPLDLPSCLRVFFLSLVSPLLLPTALFAVLTTTTTTTISIISITTTLISITTAYRFSSMHAIL